MLYQRVMGDFYPINSEGKFTLSKVRNPVVSSGEEGYNMSNR